MDLNRFSICAKNPEESVPVRRQAESVGLVYDEADPDFIFSLGGDGTYLIAERRCPGVPKLLVRDSRICFKCHDEPLGDMLKMIAAGEGTIRKIVKLQARCRGSRLLAVNDVVVRNRDPRHALRFRLRIDGDDLGQVLIGDGIVVATSFGSTGYYHSVTGRSFRGGIGVGFNNLTKGRDPLELSEQAEVELEVVRSEAHVAADNHPELLEIGKGDVISVTVAEEVARLIAH